MTTSGAINKLLSEHQEDSNPSYPWQYQCWNDGALTRTEGRIQDNNSGTIFTIRPSLPDVTDWLPIQSLMIRFEEASCIVCKDREHALNCRDIIINAQRS